MEIRAELAGTVIRLEVAEGSHVHGGDIVAMIEPMKMEVPIEAPGAGQCAFAVTEGQVVAEGGLLARIG